MARVLVVDDDPSVRKLLCTIVGFDHEVTDADSAESALRACDLEGPFDLMVIDWMMPGMTGIELIEEIRRDRGDLGRTPVIMLTAVSDPEGEHTAHEAGADAYMTKPFHPDVLSSLIDVMVTTAPLERVVHRAARKRQAVDDDVRVAYKIG